MKALRYENKNLYIADLPRPLVNGEAIVRVTLSGICNTDLEISRGYAGFQGTLGHEFVGIVESLAEARPSGRAQVASVGAISDVEEPFLTIGLLPGQRVVGEINAGCGHCDLCLAGDPRHCATRTVLGIVGRDGAHAEFVRLPARNLLAVPEEVTDHQAVFAEPLAAACGILERAAITEATTVAVIGDGKLGLLCAQLLAISGALVVLVGKHPEKLRLASQRGIETATVDEARKRARQFNSVVEASGSASGFTLALDLLQPRGVLILKSTFHGTTEIDAARLVVDEITVVGSRCGRMAPALRLLQQNLVDVESLISEEYQLADGVEAMHRAAEPGVLKVLLRP
ncbi:MAG: alcohol dehydrogenase catalytic domain-containing protein [Pyrinomonadaceae bacterium]